MDVFDEVERRDLNTSACSSIDCLIEVSVVSSLVWQNQVEKALIPLHVLPFLPVNPVFSATRNQVRDERVDPTKRHVSRLLQGRQKLARYGPKEFTTFIYDILNEVRRRYHGIVPQSPVSINSSKCTSNVSSHFHSKTFSSFIQFTRYRDKPIQAIIIPMLRSPRKTCCIPMARRRQLLWSMRSSIQMMNRSMTKSPPMKTTVVCPITNNRNVRRRARNRKIKYEGKWQELFNDWISSSYRWLSLPKIIQ